MSLGSWRPDEVFREAIRWTVAWYKAAYASGGAKALTLEQVRRCEELS